MKFIITTIGTAGDVYPFIGIAKELQRRGHTISLLTSAAYRAEIEKHGIDFHAVLSKEKHQQAINDPNVNRLLTNVSAFNRKFIIPTLQPAYNFICHHYEQGNTILISHVMFFAARIAHDKLNIPLVTVHLAPIGIPSIKYPPRFPGLICLAGLPSWAKRALLNVSLFILDRLLSLSEINAFRATIGLAPIKRIFKYWANSPQKVIGLFPPWFGVQPDDWPRQVTTTNFPLYNPNKITSLPTDLCNFLARPNKTVIFTPGSGMQYAHQFFTESIQACKKLGCDGILLSRYKQQIPHPLPDNIFHLNYVPLHALLPRVASIVHFGGIGTASQAITHAIPQLIVPNIGDQFDNALRLRQCGIALELAQHRYKTKHIAAKLHELLTSTSIHSNCQKYATLSQQSTGITAACNILESMPTLTVNAHNKKSTDIMLRMTK